MSFSSPYGFLEMGSDGAPIIDATQFREIIMMYGFNVWRRRRSLTKDCPCYDPVLKHFNPSCSICEGTGSLVGWQDRVVRAIILFNVPNGQWGLGDLHTMAGDVERVEAAGYFAGATDVQISDHILFPTASSFDTTSKYEEFRVFNVQPRVVGDGSGAYVHIFTKADMRHAETEIWSDYPP